MQGTPETKQINLYARYQNNTQQIQQIKQLINSAPDTKKQGLMRINGSARELSTNKKLELQDVHIILEEIKNNNWQNLLKNLGITLQNNNTWGTIKNNFSGIDPKELQKIRLNALKDAPDDITAKLNLSLNRLKIKPDGSPVNTADKLAVIDQIRDNN